ncbi:MAG: cytochrome c [Acidobacteria bacterium]|nr:cytochrome c [Acidobacteriota bacterium]
MTIRTAVSAALSLALASSLALAQKKGDAAKGKEVFEQCAVCHSVTGEKKMGPTLKGLYQKEKLANGQKVSDASITAMINKGKGNMPAFADVLTADEKTDLLAYLKTI